MLSSFSVVAEVKDMEMLFVAIAVAAFAVEIKKEKQR